MATAPDDSETGEQTTPINPAAELEADEETELRGDEPAGDERTEGQLEIVESPEIDDGWMPTYLQWRRNRKKRKKKARKGYVQWLLIGETYPEPKFVKPESKGGGIPEFEYQGETYFFPRSAAMPSSREGMWTYLHREGEADPINLKDPNPNAVPADSLKKYLDLRVTADPPGLMDRLDLSPQKILMYAIAAIILYALFQDFVGGGII